MITPTVIPVWISPSISVIWSQISPCEFMKFVKKSIIYSNPCVNLTYFLGDVIPDYIMWVSFLSIDNSSVAFCPTCWFIDFFIGKTNFYRSQKKKTSLHFITLRLSISLRLRLSKESINRSIPFDQISWDKQISLEKNRNVVQVQIRDL